MINYGIVILTFFILLAGCAGTSDYSPSPGDVKMIPPVLVKKPDFLYPEKAQNRGIEGEVGLYGFIDRNGNVTNVKIHNSSKYEFLDEAAKAYILQMKYTPATKNNKAIGVWLSYKIRYDLNDSGKDFQIEDYINRNSAHLNDALLATGSEREEAIQQIVKQNEEYSDYVRRHPKRNSNQYIAKLLSEETIDQWRQFFDLWPLTFILYEDLSFRFPESKQIVAIRNQMMNLMYEDLMRAEKIDQRETIKMEKSVAFAKALRVYLNENYQGEVPEILQNELERLISLY